MRFHSYSVIIVTVMASSLFGGEFTSLDINTGIAGSTVYNGLESYTVRGGGADIWNTADSFRYVYQSYSGDFDIQAKVISVDPTNTWAKAGLMLRQDTTASSIHAMMVATSGNGFAFQYRSAIGGTSSHIAGGTTGYPFSWVRLIRSGSLVAGYKSTDPIGAEWQFVGSVSLSITDPVLVGLCVTAHNNSLVCKAEFANVNIKPFVLPVSGSGTGLSAKYFNNKTFSGVPALERIDGTLDFNWLTGSPDVTVNVDNFSSHWSGFIEPQYSESYSFHTSSDDGIRVWIDGNLVLDNWTLHSPQANRTFAKTLIAGERYPVVVEFFENGGGAEARLYWSSRSTFKQIIPQSQLYPDAAPISAGEGNGLKGEYFNSREFTNHTLTRMDSTVDFNWGSASPALTVSADNFSVRWTGAVEPKHTGLYSFFTTSDDGVRLWVNNQLIVNNWTDHGPTENIGTVPLIAGQRYSVRMEYYERGGGAVAKLAWSSADQPKEIVPLTQLYPAHGSGFFAEYFDNADLSKPVFHRVDSKIDFNWGELAPDALLGVDSFSVRWSGRIEPKYSESYTFYTDTDEAVRLWVNNQLVIDNWTPHSRTENASAGISLIIGQPVEIKMEYADITGDAVAKLSWSSLSQVKQAVPTSQVYPNGGMIVSVPASSPISPAFIEGTMWSPSGALFEVTCASNSTAVPVTTLGSKRFFVNVPLQAVAGTDVSFNHSETGAAQSGLITWTTTDIAGKNSSAHQLLLRRGDALQLTAVGSGEVLTIDANGDGVSELTGVPGTVLPFQYDQVGQYVASAKIDGVLVGELLITVVDVDWRGQIACIVGYARTKNVAVLPGNAATNVVFTSADNSLLNVSLKDLTSTGAALLLRPKDRGTPIVLARLGGGSGAIIGYKEIDEYTIDLPGLHEAIVDSSTNIGGTSLTIRPYIPDIRFEFNMFAHSSTFAGGQTSLSINTSDIDLQTGIPKFKQIYNTVTNEIEGQFVFEIQVPPAESKYCFRVNAYQQEDTAGLEARSLVSARAQFTNEQDIEPAENVNGIACKAKVSKIVLCTGGPAKELQIPTQTNPNGGIYDLQIINCLAAVWENDDTTLPGGFECQRADNSQWVHALENVSTGLSSVQVTGKAVFENVIATVKVTITADKNPICVGDNVTFTATTEFANGNEMISVNWSGGGTPPTGTGSTFTTKWGSSGTKTVTATISVEGFEDTCSVTFDETVVDVGEVTATPPIVCVGETITFTATPVGGASFPANEPTWTVEGPGTANTTSGPTIVVTSNGPGTIKAIAKCGASTTTQEKTAKAVQVDKLQYMEMNGGFVDVPNPLVVCKGDTITFKALANPPGEAFPPNDPKWSGTSGATGAGETISVTFTETSETVDDLKTVIATCNTSAIAYVLVVEIVSIEGPDTLCNGHLALYTAKIKPTGADFPVGQPVWSGPFDFVDGNFGNSVIVGKLGVGTFELTVECGTSIATKTIYVVEVSSVTFVQAPASGEHGASEIEYTSEDVIRIFPDAPSYALNTTPRNIVRVQAQLYPARPNVAIYFKALDVDDPSTDPEIDPNGNGRDNRGRLISIGHPAVSEEPSAGGYQGRLRKIGEAFQSEGEVVSAITNSDGIAEVELLVSFAPGDNFIVVASCDQETIVSRNENSPNDGYGGVSLVLTVWRYLNIELDSMLAIPTPKPEPDRMKVTGTGWMLDFANGNSMLIVNRALIESQYEGGEIRSSLGTVFTVFYNDNNTLHIKGILTPEKRAEFLSEFTLTDDDDKYPAGWGAILPRFDLIGDVLKSKYRKAYIEVREDVTANSRPTIPFELNTLINNSTGADDSKDLTSRPLYWTHLVVSAYQPQGIEDGDPISDTKEFGATLDSIGTSAIFLETCREEVAGLGINFTIARLKEFIELTTAHEIGHQPGGIDDHTEGGLMGAGVASGEFSSKTIKRFRRTRNWFLYTE